MFKPKEMYRYVYDVNQNETTPISKQCSERKFKQKKKFGLEIAMFDFWEAPWTSVFVAPMTQAKRRHSEQNAVHCTIHAPWNRNEWQLGIWLYHECDIYCQFII